MGDDKKRVRSWCFTYHRVNIAELETYEADWKIVAKYYICGNEHGEKNGGYHIQGYIDFRNARTLSALKKDYGDNFHWEGRKGSWAQAVEYCKKEDDWWEWGEKAKGAGKRSDLDTAKKIIEETGSMEQVVKAVSSYQACRFAELYQKYVSKVEDFKKKDVRWYYGSTGCGKTRMVMSLVNKESVWIANDGLKWWDGYDGQEDVVFDDFRGDWCKFAYLLRVLDGYYMRVEIKGGHRELKAKRIFITCPVRPEEVYKMEGVDKEKKENALGQLMRRITEVVNMDKDASSEEAWEWVL